MTGDLVDQFAMFMQRRDAIEQGGIIDGVARPTWDELGVGGQEAYMRDALAYVGAARTPWAPPCRATDRRRRGSPPNRPG